MTSCHNHVVIDASHHAKERAGEIIALRKEDLDDDEQRDNTKKRSRMTIDISPELRRRIKLAALQEDLSIGEYVGRILEDVVPEEVSMAQRQHRPVTREAIDR